MPSHERATPWEAGLRADDDCIRGSDAGLEGRYVGVLTPGDKPDPVHLASGTTVADERRWEAEAGEAATPGFDTSDDAATAAGGGGRRGSEAGIRHVR